MKEITPSQLKRFIEEGGDLSIVDIREADEFSAWHIHGSRNLPVYEALRQARVDVLRDRAEQLPKDRKIVAVCRAGIMSQRAVDVLEGLGFDAVSLSGGIRGWGGVWSEAPIDDLGDDVVFSQVRRNGKGCLSYFVASGGEAVVVDPSVDSAAYLEIAERAGARITHVLETHVHADHLSRARELCARTGAKLVLPSNDRVRYPYSPIRDGETIRVGEIEIEAVSTPGHTGESTCYLINDSSLLTGDTLFLDSVGRPDLEKGDTGAEAGARSLHRSLREGLLARFDDPAVYPAHHAGPVLFDRVPIGSRLSDLRSKLTLLEAEEDEFVSRILERLPAKPPNFDRIIAINEGKADLDGNDPLDVEAGPNRCAAG